MIWTGGISDISAFFSLARLERGAILVKSDLGQRRKY